MKPRNWPFLIVVHVLGLLLVVIWTPGLNAQDDGMRLRQSFEGEAPKAWELYKRKAAFLQGTMVFKQYLDIATKELGLHRKYEFRQKAGQALCLEQNYRTKFESSETGTVDAINPNYEFQLRRRSPNTPWVLTKLKQHQARNSLNPYSGRRIEQWITYPITFSCLFDDLRMVPTESGYKATELTTVEFGGEKCVKVVFIYTPDGKNPRIPSIRGYSVYRPTKNWVAKEHNVTMRWAHKPDVSVTSIVNMDYSDDSDGFPIIKQVSTRYRLTGINKSYHDNSSFQFDLKEGDVADDAFTLSSFDLPEPSPKSNRNYWLVITGVAGLICLILALLIRWRKSIRSSKAQ